MRWFDVGTEANGVVAIGQFATGVIAIGQVAWGVVAVGQIAFGWFAAGQIAIGGLTGGMFGVGLHATLAMVGVGGRGRGFVLALLPGLGQRQTPRGIEPLGAVRARVDGGWVRLHLEPRPDGRIAVYDGDQPARDVRLDARVRRAASAAAPGDVWAHLRRSRDGLVADRLIGVPVPRTLVPRWWLVWGAQLMGLLLLAAAVWWMLGEVLIAAWPVWTDAPRAP
jgi:hypothetical protein